MFLWDVFFTILFFPFLIFSRTKSHKVLLNLCMFPKSTDLRFLLLRCSEVEDCYAWRWKTMEYHTEDERKECKLKKIGGKLVESSSGYISGIKDCEGTAISHVL